MTEIPELADAPLRAAESLMHAALDGLRQALDDFRRANGSAGALSTEVAALRKALQSAIDERERFGKIVQSGGGGVGGAGVPVAPYDLAAAENEVRRRMACLRRAHGDGGVSRGPAA